MTFPAAPMGARARFNLVASVAVLPGLAAGAVAVGSGLAVTLAALGTAVGLFLVGTLPKAYSVDSGELVVHRRGLPDKHFGLAGAPERFRNALALDWRWYGTGWRPAGREWSAKQGLPAARVYLAVTDRERAVTVPTEKGTVIVTPTDPEGLVSHGRAATT